MSTVQADQGQDTLAAAAAGSHRTRSAGSGRLNPLGNRVAAAPVAEHPVDPRDVLGRSPAREPGRGTVVAIAGNVGRVGRDWRRRGASDALNRFAIVKERS